MAYGIQNDIQKKVDAYRGNPQALEQQYAQKQELIDLLALQKIKSEKEAAAREMQMQMTQKQAAEGKAPTIKDQREQEVMNMTKQELAQQQGALMQQQNKERQQGLQSLMQQRGRPGMPAPQMPQMPRPPQAAQMGGIASRPAPNMARLAGGGIVAFAGEDGSYVGGPSSPFERATGLDKYGEAVDQARERNRLREQLRAKYGPKASMAGIFRNQTDAERQEAQSIVSRLNQMSVDEMRALVEGAPPPDNRALLNQADAQLRSAPVPTPEPPAPMAGPQPPTPKQGIAALQQPPMPQPAMQGMGPISPVNPLDMQKDEESRVAGVLGLTPEQRAVYDKNIKGLEALYAEEMDPEARRKRELNQFLLGAANRSSFGSVMGGGAAAAENERRRSFATRLKGTEDIQKKLESVIDIDRGAKKEGIVAGQKAGELGGQMRGQDLQLRGAEILSRDKALDREIEKLKIGSQSEYTRAIADQTNAQRMETTLRSINADIVKAEAEVNSRYEDEIANLRMRMQGEKDEAKRKKIEAELKKVIEDRQAVTQAATAAMKAQADDLLGKLRSGGNTGVSPEDQALIDKYKTK
jgi:hypothetical protein